jgi:hypothetical protein
MKLSLQQITTKTKGTPRPLLIHYHIFKNAGTSFEWALKEALGDGYRSFDTSSPRGSISASDLAEFATAHPKIKAISSHQAAPPAPRIPGREICSSILIRDPIARVRSIYAFEHSQQANTPGAIKAKELDFKEYVEWRLTTSPAMLCNYQVHFCIRKAERRSRGSNREQLEEAIANLDGIDIVGTVERYNEWLALAQAILSNPFPNISLSSSRKNVSATGEEISKTAILDALIGELGESLVDRLLEGNEIDMRLHQVADALLSRRLAEKGDGVRLRDAYCEALRNLPERLVPTTATQPQAIL